MAIALLARAAGPPGRRGQLTCGADSAIVREVSRGIRMKALVIQHVPEEGPGTIGTLLGEGDHHFCCHCPPLGIVYGCSMAISYTLSIRVLPGTVAQWHSKPLPFTVAVGLCATGEI